MKSDNKGFTLVELIVVMAIVTLLAASLLVSISSVSSGRVKQFAQLYDSMLSQCKIDTLCGAQEAYLELSLTGGVYMARLYENGSAVREKELGKKQLSCSYTAGGNSYILTEGGSPLCIGFNRETGAFLKLDEGHLAGKNASGVSAYCTDLIVSQNTSYTVHMIPETGYHKAFR